MTDHSTTLAKVRELSERYNSEIPQTEEDGKTLAEIVLHFPEIVQLCEQLVEENETLKLSWEDALNQRDQALQDNRRLKKRLKKEQIDGTNDFFDRVKVLKDAKRMQEALNALHHYACGLAMDYSQGDCDLDEVEPIKQASETLSSLSQLYTDE